MLVLVYLGAVMRHWVATMSGIASLAIGTAILWKVITPETAGRPKFWWTVSGCCFAFAMFQAWKAEYEKRVRLEQVGPQLVLEFREDDERHRGGHRWTLTNSSGSADAVNVISDEITIQDARVRIERIQRIGAGVSVEIEFVQWINDHPIGHARHPAYLLDNALKSEVAARFSGGDFADRLGDWVIPIRLSYNDAVGTPFETRGELHWNGVLDRGYVRPIQWGVVRAIPWWRRFPRTIRRRLIARSRES